MKKVSFFIFYDARSGSTYLANQLIKNYNIWIPPENNIVSLLVSSFGNENKYFPELLIDKIYQDEKFADWQMERAKTEQLFDDKKKCRVSEFLNILFEGYLNEVDKKGCVFGIKKGSYLNYWKQVDDLFPESKYVCLIRDGRAVFNSKKRSLYSKTGRPFEKDPTSAASLWVKSVREIRNLKKHKPHQTHVIKYEDLIQNHEDELRRVAEFVGGNVKPILSRDDVFLIDRYKQFNSHQNIDKPPLPENLAKWKNGLTRKELVQYEAIAGRTLLNEGYQLETGRFRRALGVLHSYVSRK